MHRNNKHEQDIRIYESLRKIRRVICVMSGKGGVGKTTVSVNLASTLADSGYRVGIMDVDIHGPNVPKMLGIDSETFGGVEEAVTPVQIRPNFFAASIGLVGYAPNEAFIWRGPMKIALVRQFLGDVHWGSLDYLIIDTPPGTGDEALTTAQLIPTMAGAVIVSTPQDISILDSSKSITFARKLEVPILGIVENMSGFACPHCGEVSRIFGEGGAKKAAERYRLPFLGSIPLDPGIVHSADSGRPFVQEQAHEGAGGRQNPQHQEATQNPAQNTSQRALAGVIQRIHEEIDKNEEAGVYTARSLPDPRTETQNTAQADGTGFRPVQ